jgi:PBP1b-binding outer membrane lipoprotein LpoB
MKIPHISLLLVSVFLVSCASTSPKVSATKPPEVAADYISPEDLAKLDRDYDRIMAILNAHQNPQAVAPLIPAALDLK